MNFLGLNNVVDVEPILGADGMADGFNVRYNEERVMRNGKKRMVERKKTVYVREFDPNSVSNDGVIHGFGRGTVYTKSSGKKRQQKKMNLSVIQSIVSKKHE